ncbi:MAG: hypothetical protein JST82_15990 [Bacteroidetes bacterium]|nr:hypothetical protein [Bacteroidota bacterium]
MQVNWWVIVILIATIGGLVYFIIRQNRKDEKNLEQTLEQEEFPHREDDAPKM